MSRLSLVLCTTALLCACGVDKGFGPGEGDVTGTWTGALPGTVFAGEDGTGQTTSLTLTLAHSGTVVTGSESFTDTQGRSGSEPVTGTFIGMTLSFAREDFDPACGGRLVTSVAWVSEVESGATMTVGFGANPVDGCPVLADSVVYTKR